MSCHGERMNVRKGTSMVAQTLMTIVFAPRLVAVAAAGKSVPTLIDDLNGLK